jgi:hypothetical protein
MELLWWIFSIVFFFKIAQNIINDMKTNLNSLVKLKNPEKYTNLTESLDKNKNILQEKIEKYSKENQFDQILVEYHKNKTEVDLFKNVIHNDELLMVDLLQALKKNQDNFNKNKNVKEINQALGIESVTEIRSALQGINEVYAKVQGGSNILIFYDIEKKKFTQRKTDLTFPSRCYSYFMNNSVYVSGGMINKTPLNNFSKFEIKINFDELVYEEKALESMKNSRHSHAMISHKDYLLAIGGSNTSNEIYDIAKNVWHDLPQLPSIYLNPTLCINKDWLYMFTGSVGINTLDRIYKLSLNNITRVLCEKGFEDVLYWESIDYYFPDHNRLRRGMTALNLENSIILMGGFNNDNMYDHMYNFELVKRKPKEHKDVKEQIEEEEEPDDVLRIIKLEETLPIKTFFNSNIMKYENHLVMIDAYNNAIELDLNTMDFYYYT